MTDLTEQWEKGKLPSGRYYTLVNGGGYEDYTSIQFYNEYTNEFDKHPLITKQVLAKVPTYEEYQALLSDQLAKNEGVEINAELEKDLGIAHSTCDYIFNEKEKAVNDCKTLAQKLLQVKPELREWLEVNFKEYL